MIYAVAHEDGHGLEEPFFSRAWQADWEAWKLAHNYIWREGGEVYRDGLFWRFSDFGYDGWAAHWWPRDTIAWVHPVEVKP